MIGGRSRFFAAGLQMIGKCLNAQLAKGLSSLFSSLSTWFPRDCILVSIVERSTSITCIISPLSLTSGTILPSIVLLMKLTEVSIEAKRSSIAFCASSVAPRVAILFSRFSILLIYVLKIYTFSIIFHKILYNYHSNYMFSITKLFKNYFRKFQKVFLKKKIINHIFLQKVKKRKNYNKHLYYSY